MPTVAKRLNSIRCGVPFTKPPPEIEGATLAPLVLATVIFIIRIIAKGIGLGGGWGPDDYTIIVAWVRPLYSPGQGIESANEATGIVSLCILS